MKPHFSAIVFSCLIANSAFVSAQVQAPPKVKESAIDFSRARSLLEKERGGQQLSQDEREYLNRAKAFRRNQQRQGQPGAAGPRQRIAPERLLPLTDMTAEDRYEGEDGGLYGGGRNAPPESSRQDAAAALAKIQPLDGPASRPTTGGSSSFPSACRTPPRSSRASRSLRTARPQNRRARHDRRLRAGRPGDGRVGATGRAAVEGCASNVSRQPASLRASPGRLGQARQQVGPPVRCKITARNSKSTP